MKVGLVDDHDIVGLGIEAVVAQIDDLEFVGAVGTVRELLATFPDVDIAVLDLRLADGSSPVANVERLTAAGVRTLILTSGESPYLMRAVARCPIVGLVRKSAPRSVLEDTLRKIVDGDVELSTEWASVMDSDPELAAAGLSPQEERVLAQFAQGVKAQTVAYELGITKNTVDDYVRRIRAKYAAIGRPAHTKIDLYRRAVEDGILPSALLPDAH
ncbi:response regulator transcription factor [Microbacterium luticocti]|uniref:response regulator transcription factor n=1 Tax=Microbacterium luticocti TaxID=451764 RepID=UPI000491D80B|nr:response regulator transcription factor [Microbacterium luticocti]